MKHVVYALMYLGSFLPERLMCRLFYLFVYRVVHYRVDIVRSNLKGAFVDKSEEQLLAIEKKFYHQLCDLMVETIMLARLTKKQVVERFEFINGDQLERYLGKRSWIVAMAHYGSWELATSWAFQNSSGRSLAVYRPLHNKSFDHYFHIVRSKFGLEPVSMEEVGRRLIGHNHNDEQVTLALIADQTPLDVGKADWIDFLGRKTPFFTGMEKFATKLKMPIAYLHIERFGRKYKAWFEIIYDGDQPIEKGDISRAYAAALETDIRRAPHLWMWSHNRWKRSSYYENMTK